MIGEQPRREEDMPQEVVPQEGVTQAAEAPKSEVKEAPFNKGEACDGLDTAIDELYARFGNNIPESIQAMGEEVRDTVDAIKRNSKVSSREQVIEDINFKKGNMSEAAYNFIIEHVG
jgi:hypothetical protein